MSLTPFHQSQKDEAIRFAESIRTDIEEIGQVTQKRLAEILNEKGVATPSGMGRWHQRSVQRVLKHLKESERQSKSQ